jgi:hypothetical protein
MLIGPSRVDRSDPSSGFMCCRFAVHSSDGFPVSRVAAPVALHQPPKGWKTYMLDENRTRTAPAVESRPRSISIHLGIPTRYGEDKLLLVDTLPYYSQGMGRANYY